ncbi:hypothetical protein [Undibacterium danionis]|uniref:Uncharacterized protein n=1 Tax=Undibacterium danionis TaxID=1812100 RepID=A0ABV6IDF3_9BURK
MSKTRAKNLDPELLEVIVGILDGWFGKLTWDLLIKAIEERTKVLYTRQGLDRHSRIKNAYSLAKARMNKTLGIVPIRDLSPTESNALLDRYERLEAENARLKFENDQFFEQFVRWAYNAHLRGLSENYLNSPLPSVDRERTIEKKKK